MLDGTLICKRFDCRFAFLQLLKNSILLATDIYAVNTIDMHMTTLLIDSIEGLPWFPPYL